MSLPRLSLPNLSAYVGRGEARPAYKRALPVSFK
jgi:hypothetical protein